MGGGGSGGENARGDFGGGRGIGKVGGGWRGRGSGEGERPKVEEGGGRGEGALGDEWGACEKEGGGGG